MIEYVPFCIFFTNLLVHAANHTGVQNIKTLKQMNYRYGGSNKSATIKILTFWNKFINVEKLTSINFVLNFLQEHFFLSVNSRITSKFREGRINELIYPASPPLREVNGWEAESWDVNSMHDLIKTLTNNWFRIPSLRAMQLELLQYELVNPHKSTS